MMRLVPKRQTLELTGLSPAKLREWTSRRALIPADVPPKKQGSSAQFSWQTILVLRLAVTLKDRFRLELQAHRALFAGLRHSLKGRSFIALWDQALVLRGPGDWVFAEVGSAEALQDDAVIVRLNPHLEVLATGFALPRPSETAGQLDLFPAVPVGRQRAEPRQKAPVTEGAAVKSRKRSA
jgi:hypothetical protein